MLAEQKVNTDLFVNRAIGKVYVPPDELSKPCNETALRIDGPGGAYVTGLGSKKSTVTLRWECLEPGWLDVTILRLKHLPKVDRFGLCDAQVRCCGHRLER